MSTPASLRGWGLTGWLAVSVGVVMLAGSLGLLAVFRYQARREHEQNLASLARANAAFLDRMGYPATSQFAAQLGDVLETRVFLLTEAREWRGAPGDAVPDGAGGLRADGTVHRLAEGLLGCAVPLNRGGALLLIRPESEGAAALRRPDTWAALGVFWIMALVAGSVLARRVARPLRQVSAALPSVAGDSPLPMLPTHRSDEIGMIARALQETRDTLRSERDRRRAAERLAVLGRMAASLAHEVRNPAAAIRLHAQLLDGTLAAESEISRRCIEDDAERIESLVSQWMIFARPEPPHRELCALFPLTAEACARLQAQAAHAGVVLEAVSPDEPVDVPVDRVRFQQAAGNVLLNAIQASPPGGRVTVRCGRSGAGVAVQVEDEGPGFSADALERAAEPFYSEREGGMGLGLAVAAEVCRGHGGGLRLENRSGRGARVILTFSPT